MASMIGSAGAAGTNATAIVNGAIAHVATYFGVTEKGMQPAKLAALKGFLTENLTTILADHSTFCPVAMSSELITAHGNLLGEELIKTTIGDDTPLFRRNTGIALLGASPLHIDKRVQASEKGHDVFQKSMSDSLLYTVNELLERARATPAEQVSSKMWVDRIEGIEVIPRRGGGMGRGAGGDTGGAMV